MFEKIEIFQMAFGLAKHATARQELVARNMANADTPGYRAVDIAPFSETYRANDQPVDMRITRPGHISAQPQPSGEFRSFETNDPESPNGNNVSLEGEMVKASDLRLQHELALSIYSSSLNILRTSLGRR